MTFARAVVVAVRRAGEVTISLSPAVLLLAGTARAADWSFGAALGAAYSFDSRLELEQAGFERLAFTPGYRTRPFETPFCYGLRLARRDGSRAWEVSLIHHKLYPVDTPAEVRDFSISHGYKLVTINRAYGEPDRLNWRFGAGLVVTHVEAPCAAYATTVPMKSSGRRCSAERSAARADRRRARVLASDTSSSSSFPRGRLALRDAP